MKIMKICKQKLRADKEVESRWQDTLPPKKSPFMGKSFRPHKKKEGHTIELPCQNSIHGPLVTVEP